MNSPLVSVVIPSYNHAQFVQAAIDSVLDQTLSDIELIIIDDGSTDGSIQRIEHKLRQIRPSRARLIARANHGLCRTLNEGLRLSLGLYFAYLGSDDIWEPTKLEKQLRAIEAEGPNTGAAFADCYIIDRNGQRLGQFGHQCQYHGGDIYHDLVWSRFHPSSPTNLFMREKLILAGGFRESIPIEDRDTWVRIARYYRVAYVPEPLASFRVHSTNTHTQHPERMLYSNERTLEWLLRCDPQLKPSHRRLRAQLQSGYAGAFYESLDLRRCRKEAFRSFCIYPFERLAWRMLTRSVLGGRLLTRIRKLRRAES
jgi:alpha-1,3-rhamnosyltransferase